MEIEQAKEEVSNIGESYFYYDETSRYRYISSPISLPEAKNLFLQQMNNPGIGLANSDGFGGKNTLGGPGYHPAVDFHSILGQIKGIPISPIFSGIVVGVYNNRSDDFGLHIVVEHDIHEIRLYSIYAHLDSISTSKNEIVTPNSILGGMGNTPFEQSGSIHLHLEVRTAKNVQLDESNNYIGLPRTPESYWADSYSEMKMNWVDLGLIYGYSNLYPTNWK